MNGLSGIGKALIMIGILVVGIGVLVLLATKMPWIGRLPGDFFIKGKRFTLYFPLMTSLLFSLILTIIFWLINRK